MIDEPQDSAAESAPTAPPEPTEPAGPIPPPPGVLAPPPPAEAGGDPAGAGLLGGTGDRAGAAASALSGPGARPELGVGIAFAGGLAAALLLRRLGS